MKIANTSIVQTASHELTKRSETRESLQMWTGPRPAETRAAPPSPPPGTRVTLSDMSQALVGDGSLQRTEGDSTKATDFDPKLTLIRSVLEFIFGRSIDVFDATELQRGTSDNELPAAPQASQTAQAALTSAGFGIAYDYHASYTEDETTSYAAAGVVRTRDGREINFSVSLNISRSYHEESNVSLRLGDAARKVDPLVLNFNGSAAQLTDQRFSFDLDADGKKERISVLAPNSGFLVFDRNSNGKIDDGREMFGPQSGNGFQDLAALDEDQNGWIDENDAAFNKLGLWRPDESGTGQLQSLAKANIGAISLNSINTPFDIKNGKNELIGNVRSSAMFLQENGIAGTIQQIDLTA